MELPLNPISTRTNHAHEIFKEHLVLVYRILRRLSNAQSTNEILQILANQVDGFADEPVYNRYSRAFVLKVIYEELMQNSFPYRPDENLKDLSKDDHYLLILRDAYQVSTHELASIFNTSEGSILIRLQGIRRKVFGLDSAASTTNVPAVSLDQSDEKNRAEQNDISTFSEKDLATFSSPVAAEIFRYRNLSSRFFKSVPEPITPAGLQDLFKPVIEPQKKSRFHINLETAPWYYKIVLEALLATTVVVCIILSLPLIKRSYEFWVERRLDLYNLADSTAFTDQESRNSALIEKISETGTPAVPTDTQTVQENLNKNASDIATSTTSSAPAQNTESKITFENEFATRANEKPSADKIYRILINTDSPDQIRKQVRTLLSSMKNMKTTKDVAGIELPGGIMFDIYIPLDQYSNVLKNLATMGQVKVITTRPKQEKIIPGSAHFKIWLQKI